MLELRFAGAWRLVSIVGLLLVLTATMVPADWIWPEDPNSILYINDKWLHGITFGLLAVWFCGQYAASQYWRVAVGLLAFGALIEICQRAVSYRSSDLLDLTADVAGITVGLLIALAGAGGWSLRLESWLQDQFG